MFGILGEIAEGVGKVVGTVVGVPAAAIAITLGVSVDVVKSAISAGCTTVEEIKDFINDI